MSADKRREDDTSDQKRTVERRRSALNDSQRIFSHRDGRVRRLEGTGLKKRHPETQALIDRLGVANIIIMILYNVSYWGQIFVAVGVVEWSAARLGFGVGMSAYLLSILWIGRTMRALECMVHEAAHFNFSQKYKLLNDLLGNLLAAVPMLLTVQAVRASHNHPHHSHLAEVRVDPDRLRYDRHEAHDLDRSSAIRFTREIAIRLPGYMAGWFSTLGMRWSTVIHASAWHAAIIIIGATIFYADPIIALIKWICFWAVPYLAVLTPIRFIGETGKHLYYRGKTTIDVTVSNIGLSHRVFIHPFGDGYHTLHHLYPFVPGYRLSQLHRWFVINEQDYRQKLRYRLRILEHPRRGL